MAPASFFRAAWAPADVQAVAPATSGSPSTVSKNVISSAEVGTARTAIPSVPHASMTARRVSRQPGWSRASPRPRPPSHSAESRSTHRNSPWPGRSDRSRERSEKYSRSPGRNPRAVTCPEPDGWPGSGKRSSGSGHAAACSGSSRAAVTLAASCDSRKPHRSPTEANGLRPRLISSVSSYGFPARSLHATATTVRTEPSTQRSAPITER